MRAWGRVVQNQHGEINNFARLFLMFVLFGYGAMTAGRLGAGKTPHDPGEPKTWLAAAARSGALGLYADFLLGEKARLRSRQRMPGEGTTTEPGARPGNLWFSDNGEKRKTYNNTFRPFFTPAPGNRLFWSRVALDHFIGHNLYEMLNPGYLSRMKRHAGQKNVQVLNATSPKRSD